ncbi:DUF3195 domain-containing protein [Pyrobaculum sp. 3827-6]|uniref:DUF3195 domain-containing protein n=1 Tax=Pyrobaculum sp. 3827-6 TaxID=2983604 RepID=UPI0035A89052
MERGHVLIRTAPRKDKIVARDLCDCLYYYDQSVKCEVIGPGLVYVNTSTTHLGECLDLFYFRKIIKNIEIYDYVSRERPECSSCVVVAVGGLYFVRRVG